MIQKILINLFILLLILSVNIQSTQKVEEINYSQLTVNHQRVGQDVKIKFQRSIFNRYQFPHTWQIKQFLEQVVQQSANLPKISNIDDQISYLKSSINQFLKLSSKAELLVKNIQQLPPMKNDPTLLVKDQQFAVLDDHQAKLTAIQDQINNKGMELQKIVSQMMLQQQNPFFKQAAFNFEKRALQQKITLLIQLKQQAQTQKQFINKKQNDKRVTRYFNDIQTIFETEGGLIDAIDTLLKNHNELTILKARVTSLTSQLKAHQLTFAQKSQCASQFQKIKQKQHHDRQVIKLVQSLKHKKLQYSQPNKYCEGVVKKLIERIKKLLVGYDYVFECARQLDLVKNNRDKVKQQLVEAQKKLDDLQLSQGIQKFRSSFENNRAVITKKIEELKTLQLDDFYQYPQLIQDSIQQSRYKIRQIQQELANLPKRSSYDLQQAQNRIKQKVNEIKSLKASHCKQSELYNENVKIIQTRLDKLQQQQAHNEWVKEVQVEKFKQLEQIKQEMQIIQLNLLNYLK